MARVSVVTATEHPVLGRHTAVVADGTTLTPGALGRMAAVLDADPDVDVVTADYEVADGSTTSRAYTPAWSPERMRHHPVAGPVLVTRTGIVEALPGGVLPGDTSPSSIHDAALRVGETSQRWHRLPFVAARCDAIVLAADRSAVAAHLERIASSASVTEGDRPRTVRIVHHDPAAPSVSVIVPTRGTEGIVFGNRRTFVVDAVRSLVERSEYRALEFVIVYDTATPEPVLDELRDIVGDGLVLVEYGEPFDFSDKVNVGVAASSGSLLLLLNDDTELIAPDSLSVLVGHLADPGVAMVGAKLLFEDGTLQHGGHVYHGDVHHACFGWPGDSPGPAPLSPLAVARECSGVTAGCALVRRSVFDEVGGFDSAFPHNYNDVDFSLKVRAAGHRIVWTPWSTWYHFESRTRVADIRPDERTRLDERWHDELRNDPYYHPDLPSGPADWRPAPTASPNSEPSRSLVARTRSFVGRTLLRRRMQRPHGVNLIGYLGATSGLGERVRELERVLAAADVPYSRWDLDLTESARSSTPAERRADDDVIFDTTIAVVTALAFPALADVYPPLVDEVDRVVGYWFWELDEIPDSHRPAIAMVDEIWAPTTFVRDAYGAAVDIPVHLVPLPIRPPVPSGRDRASFGIDDRFAFLTSFDHLSAMERKHPVGVVEAFRRAFPGRNDVMLIVKSINGHLRPDQTDELLAAAGDDARIDLRDGYLSDGDQAALLAAADCYVSLHRSEGLGLHIAESMWLGTPVVATDYSGSVDLTSPLPDGDPVAELVPYRLVTVERGGEAYTSGRWADPDLDAAAAALRRVADDPSHRSRMIEAARRRAGTTDDLDGAAAAVTSLLRSKPARGSRRSLRLPT